MNTEVESFTIDHTKLCAPFIRQCGIFTGKHGDKIYKYDLRFTQPNKDFIPTKAMHSLEHLLAVLVRKYLDNVIDISPMGCRTGFYLITMNVDSIDAVAKALEECLLDILSAETVPAANEFECGGAKYHDLSKAKELAAKVLSEKDKWRQIYKGN